MATHRNNQTIDWTIAGLDGGLFARARGSDPLITIPFETAPEGPERASLAPVELYPPDERLFFSEPEIPSVPERQRLTPVTRRVIPAPVSSRRTRLMAAGVTTVILFASFAAMAFSRKFSEPSRTRAVVGAPVDVRYESRTQVRPVEIPALLEVPALLEKRSDELVMTGPTTTPAAPNKPESPATAGSPGEGPTGAAAPSPGDTKSLGSMLAAAVARPADLDRTAAAIAIAFAGRRAASCTAPDDPRVSMPVSVTFAASGTVTSARVDGGPFAGTEIGGCIARQLRSARVRAFDGGPVTVHGSIRLH